MKGSDSIMMSAKGLARDIHGSWESLYLNNSFTLSRTGALQVSVTIFNSFVILSLRKPFDLALRCLTIQNTVSF